MLRRMVEASRKYQRIVQAGLNMRCEAETRAGLPDSMQVDALGEVMFKGKTIPVQVYSVQ